MSTSSLMIVAVFWLGYFMIAIESVTKINKAAIALPMFVLCWTLFMIDPSQYVPGAIGAKKALAVSDLKKSPALPEIPDGADVLLAECGYFEVRRLRFSGEGTVTASGESFTALTVTEGEGTLVYDGGELDFAKGDTLFIPAQKKSFAVKGNCEMILSRAK